MVRLAGGDRHGAGAAGCTGRWLEHGLKRLKANGSAAVVGPADVGDVVVGVGGAGQFPQAQPRRVSLLGSQVPEQHHVCSRLHGEDGHSQVRAEQHDLRGRDVRPRRLRQRCAGTTPTVYEEAAVHMRKGLDRVDVDGEAERGLRLPATSSPAETLSHFDDDGPVEAGRIRWPVHHDPGGVRCRTRRRHLPAPVGAQARRLQGLFSIFGYILSTRRAWCFRLHAVTPAAPGQPRAALGRANSEKGDGEKGAGRHVRRRPTGHRARPQEPSGSRTCCRPAWATARSGDGPVRVEPPDRYAWLRFSVPFRVGT